MLPVLPLVALPVLLLVSLPVLVPVAELPLPAAAEPDKEITAKSTRPEAGLISTSRMVPSDCPEELVTWALVSWLARTGLPLPMLWLWLYDPEAVEEPD